jgi:hypothetical protein
MEDYIHIIDTAISSGCETLRDFEDYLAEARKKSQKNQSKIISNI